MAEIDNLDLGLYYNPDKKCYFRGYDKDKTEPLNKDGLPWISISDRIEMTCDERKKENGKYEER